MIQSVGTALMGRGASGIAGLSFAPLRFRAMMRWSRRAVARRGRRVMVLPETLLVVSLLIFGNTIVPDLSPGQEAQAAVGSVAVDYSKRDVRGLQAQLRGNPDMLGSLNPTQLVSAFSYSDLDRDEGAIKILQFRGSDCVLHVIVDMDSRSVSHYEFNPRQMAFYDGGVPTRTPVVARDCVADILKSRRV